MTTKDSPLAALAAQAVKIARTLKAAESGSKVDRFSAEKVAAARVKPNVKFGVVMDDKTIVIDMPWAKVRDTDEAGLAQYIVDKMQESKDAKH